LGLKGLGLKAGAETRRGSVAPAPRRAADGSETVGAISLDAVADVSQLDFHRRFAEAPQVQLGESI
jgi:hypothetical protein